MTGYEELDAHGDWLTDATYGTVWTPRAVPVGWAPYRDGRWRWVAAVGLDLGRRRPVGLCTVPLRSVGCHRQSLVLVAGQLRRAAGVGAGTGRLRRQWNFGRDRIRWPGGRLVPARSVARLPAPLPDQHDVRDRHQPDHHPTAAARDTAGHQPATRFHLGADSALPRPDREGPHSGADRESCRPAADRAAATPEADRTCVRQRSHDTSRWTRCSAARSLWAKRCADGAEVQRRATAAVARCRHDTVATGADPSRRAAPLAARAGTVAGARSAAAQTQSAAGDRAAVSATAEAVPGRTRAYAAGSTADGASTKSGEFREPRQSRPAGQRGQRAPRSRCRTVGGPHDSSSWLSACAGCGSLTAHRSGGRAGPERCTGSGSDAAAADFQAAGCAGFACCLGEFEGC